MRISISSYDAATLTSLTNDDAARQYEAAVQERYPHADIVLCDGQMPSVTVTLDDDEYEYRLESDTVEACRAIIGAVWERLTIEHPYVDRLAEFDAVEYAETSGLTNNR
jgi:hypothetical protein